MQEGTLGTTPWRFHLNILQLCFGFDAGLQDAPLHSPLNFIISYKLTLFMIYDVSIIRDKNKDGELRTLKVVNDVNYYYADKYNMIFIIN